MNVNPEDKKVCKIMPYNNNNEDDQSSQSGSESFGGESEHS